MDYMVSRREQLYGSIFTILLSFALFYYSHTENREITDIELTSITGTLKEQPFYDTFKIKSTTYIDLVLPTQEHIKSFRLAGHSFNAAKRNLIEKLVVGDKIEIGILKEDSNKVGKDSEIELFSIKNNNIDLMSLYDLNKQRLDNRKFSYSFSLSFLAFLPLLLFKCFQNRSYKIVIPVFYILGFCFFYTICSIVIT